MKLIGKFKVIFIRRVILYPLSVLMDTPKRLANWISIKILRNESKYTVKGQILHSKKIAIYAIYPETTTWESFFRTAMTLKELDYQVICIVNSNASSLMWVEKIHVAGFTSIHRKNIGADFGAYKLGIKILQMKNIYQGLSDLVLINDSIYLTPKSVASLREIADGKNGYNCLYLHKQWVPHAGSMLVRLDQMILNSPPFLRFWRKYYSYSNKKKVIRRGEHGLSRACGVTYFKPFVNTNEISSPSEIQLETVDILQVLTWTQRSSLPANLYVEKSIELADYFRVVEYVICNLQISNSLGLFFARELHAPIKMDLVTSALINLTDFKNILSIQGCSHMEISEAEKILRMRGSYFEAGILDRIARA
jgi:hypothetical protein